MKKIFALLLAILVVSSFSITAFAAPVDEATIDTSRTGSLDIYKYDLTNAEKDGVWDSSYVSTGVKDESGVEAVLGDPSRVSALNANGNAYGYAIKGVEFTYVKVADIRTFTESEDDAEHIEVLYPAGTNTRLISQPFLFEARLLLSEMTDWPMQSRICRQTGRKSFCSPISLICRIVR